MEITPVAPLWRGRSTDPGEGARTVHTFCRLCTAGCGVVTTVEGDRVTGVRGDRDHPVSAGYICPKGRALDRMHHHPDRLERPLRRDADRRLREVSWEACLDDLGERLRAVIDRHGPDAVGVFFGSGVGMDAAGYTMAQALHSALGTAAKFSPASIDGIAKPLVSDLVGGTRALGSRTDMPRASFVLFVGTNPLVSHGHNIGMSNPVAMLRELRQHARVWVIDPRRTETARAADGHLAPRPGTDHAVLAHMVRELVREDTAQEILRRRCTGADRLVEVVEPFTAERAAAIADVPEEDLAALLDAVRRAGRIGVETGTGVTMSRGANVTQWLAWVLLIITDSMNRPGGAFFHPGYKMQMESIELPISPPDGGFGPGPRSRPEVRAYMGEWPCAVLPDEIAAGNIKALLNLGGHLVTAFPDRNRMVPALKSLEVLATIEIIGNETTALSTHVLPTKDQLERPDVTLWDQLSMRVEAQYTEAVVEPVGDRRSTWWVLAELGSRLGFELLDPAAEASDHAQLEAAAGGRARRPYEQLVRERRVEVDLTLPAQWVEDHLDRLGGWRIAPELLVSQLQAMSEPAGLVLVPRRQRNRVNSQLSYLGEEPTVLLHPEDARAAGVQDGEPVVVRNANGELTGTALVDAGMRRGAVSVPHGHENGNVNNLTSKDDIDPITGMAWYSGVPVTVHASART